MSVSNPLRYFEAKQITVMSATPQTPSAGGTLTAATPLDLLLLGVFDHFTWQLSRNLFEYSAANATDENYQPGKRSWTASIGQLDQGGKVSVLQDVYAAYDYLRVSGQATDPFTGVAGKYFVVIGSIGELTGGMVEGKNATLLELKPCGIPIQWIDIPTI